MPLRSLARRSLAAALLLAACSDSTGPDVRRIVLEEEVVGEVRRGEAIDFTVDIEPGTWVSLRLGAPADPIRARLYADDVEQVSIVGGFDEEDGEPAWLSPMLAEAGVRYRIRIEPHEQGSGGVFSLLLTRADIGPESHPSSLEVGELVEGETIAHPADIDMFWLDATAGEEFNVFLQSMNPSNSGGLRGWIVSEIPGAPAFVPGFFEAAPAAGGLSDRAHGTITIPQTGRYRIEIFGGWHHVEGQFTGPYRLLLYPVNRAPEASPVSLVPGDTLETESIDDVGDVDLFTLSGTPGSRWVLFVEAGGVAPHAIVADVGVSGGASAADAAGGATLLANPSPLFVMPASGSVAITVAGERSALGAYRGPYRLYAHAVGSAPESGDAAFALDQPVSGAIDVVGDADEWTVDVPDDTVVTFSIARPAGTQGGAVEAAVIDASGAARLTLSTYSPSTLPGEAAQAHTARTTLPAGRYTVRVAGATDGPGGFAGAYTVALRRVRTLPETAAATIDVGDVVTGESISPAGDLDIFRLTGTAADTVTVVFSAEGDPFEARLAVHQPGIGTVAEVQLDRTNGGDSRETGRMVLPESDAELRVSAAAEGADPAQTGEYRIAVERISAAPETRAAALALDEMAMEGLGRPGDLDDFVFTGTPGDSLIAILNWTSPAAPDRTGRLRAMDPVSGLEVAWVDGATRPVATDAFVMPAGGVLRLRVAEQGGCAVAGCGTAVANAVGDYTVTVHRYGGAPESRAATIAVGDTVGGEAIDFPGDIDVFTFAGTAGQRIELGATIPWPADRHDPIHVELFAANTGASLGTLVAVSPVQELEDNALRMLVLPETGTYRIHVRGEWAASDWGPYLLRLIADP